MRVIEDLVRKFALPIRVFSGETMREADGLAMPSRNVYLSTEARSEAPQLHGVLLRIVHEIRQGRSDLSTIEHLAMESWRARNWRVDYISVRDRLDLSILRVNRPWVVLGAAQLRNKRWINNVEV